MEEFITVNASCGVTLFFIYIFYFTFIYIHFCFLSSGVSLTIHKNNVSLCSVGMARSQSITSLTACLTKENNLIMECKFTPAKQINTTCTYEVNKTVVASTSTNKQQEPTYKNQAKINLESDKCLLNLTGFPNESPKMYNCTIQHEKPFTKGLSLQRGKIYIYVYGPSLSGQFSFLLLKNKCWSLPNACFSFLVTSCCILLLFLICLFLFLAHALSDLLLCLSIIGFCINTMKRWQLKLTSHSASCRKCTAKQAHY